MCVNTANLTPAPLRRRRGDDYTERVVHDYGQPHPCPSPQAERGLRWLTGGGGVPKMAGMRWCGWLLVGVVVVAVLAGCGRRQVAPTGRPAASRPSAPAAPAADQRTPVQVVTAYLEALYDKDYRQAYELLDAASQQRHPFEDFRRQAEGGVTQYDLGTAQATRQVGDEALVTIRLLEDPASAGFHLRREEGAWRIIYTSGSPGFPYP